MILDKVAERSTADTGYKAYNHPRQLRKNMQIVNPGDIMSDNDRYPVYVAQVLRYVA